MAKKTFAEFVARYEATLDDVDRAELHAWRRHFEQGGSADALVPDPPRGGPDARYEGSE